MAAYAATEATQPEVACDSLRKELGLGGWRFGALRGKGGPFGGIEVSEEYVSKVTKIAEDDADVQNLLNEGYEISQVKPIISAKVDSNGDVIWTAKTAILTLQKDTTGRATVTVSLEQAKVTEIVIIARTVIKKP